MTGKRVVDIGVLLDIVLLKNRIAENIEFRTLSEHFEELVGPSVSPHVKILSLDRHTLVLKADTSVWKQELFLQKNAIIEKCNLLLDKPFVHAIRFA